MDADAAEGMLVKVTPAERALTQQIPQQLSSWLVEVNGPFLSSGIV